MPLQLRLATEADGPTLGRIARDAFQDSLSRSLFPPHLNSQSGAGDAWLDEAQWRATRTIRRMKEGKPTFVVVDVPENGSSTETVVGFAQWELPWQPTSPDGGVCEAAKDPVPQTLDEGKLREMYEIIDIETKRALGPDGHSKMWCKFMCLRLRRLGRMLTSCQCQTSCSSRLTPTNTAEASAKYLCNMD